MLRMKKISERVSISLYLVLVEDIIWFVVKHHVMILGLDRVRSPKKHNSTGNILSDPDENF